MNPQVMDKLAGAGDFCELTKGILALCEPYGPVHSFRMVHNRGAARVACFIELEATRLQPALARALGVRAVNGTVCLDLPVQKDFGARDDAVSLAPADGRARSRPWTSAVP